VRPHVVPLLAAIALASCSSTDEDAPRSADSDTSKQVKEILTNVSRLRFGTVSDVRAMRGTGPFYDFDVPPGVMLDAAEKAMKSKVAAVFPNPRALEVIAKERRPDMAWDDSYAPSFLSAAIVIVHPVPGDPHKSKVEIHAIDRGPFDRGSIPWEAELPRLLAQYSRAAR
jgi:hypothetical protein